MRIFNIENILLFCNFFLSNIFYWTKLCKQLSNIIKKLLHLPHHLNHKEFKNLKYFD